MHHVSRFSMAARKTVVPALGAMALVTVVVSGCTGSSAGSTADAGTYTAPVPVIQPGRPGETATTYAPGQAAPRPQEAGWNSADLYFVSMMILHHTQALRMAELADGRSSDPRVQAVAERVSAAQAPEIVALKAWLTTRRQKVPDSAESDEHHTDMPGAVTPLNWRPWPGRRGPSSTGPGSI